MSVASILMSKGSDEVLTIGPDAPVSEAAKTLSERRIGSLVVTDAGAVVGILSERDIVRGLSQCGASVLTQPVRALMTEKVESCTRSETIDTVMRKMTDGRFRHMPVMEGGKLVGVISIGDVVKHRIADLQHEAETLRGYVMS